MKRYLIKMIQQDEESDSSLESCERGHNRSLNVDESEICCDCKFYYSCRDALPDELDALNLSYMLDQWAENANYHLLVGVHENLARLIDAEAGKSVADKIMLKIAQRGGLHCMKDED